MLRRLALRTSSDASFASLSRFRPGGSPHALDGAPPSPLTSHDDFSLPCANPQSLAFARRFLDIHKMGSKEAIEKEKARLKDELNRGYFADIQEFNKHGGKVAMANKTIIPSVMAVKFPEVEVSFSNGRSIKLPIDFTESGKNSNQTSNSSAVLICLSFRASSQAMTESWGAPFLNTFSESGKVQMYEVSFIDSWLLSLAPIKQLMLRIMKKPDNPLRQTVYSFGDHYDFRKKLNILNLLTGYAFLLDRFGRIRWQGFGMATENEVSSLISCTSVLLDEN